MKNKFLKSAIIPGVIGFLSLCIIQTANAEVPDTVKHSGLQNIADKEKIEMEIAGFSDNGGNAAYIIFLKEVNKENDIYLPIVIGNCEAMSINREMAGIEIGRPLTYQLFGNLLNEMNVILEEIIITSVKDNIFYSRVIFKQGEKRWILDARPSDALNLALRMKSKVYTYRNVIDEAGQEIED